MKKKRKLIKTEEENEEMLDTLANPLALQQAYNEVIRRESNN